MANYDAVWRTNHCEYRDVDAIKSLARIFGVEIWSTLEEGRTVFAFGRDDGGSPSVLWDALDEDELAQIESLTDADKDDDLEFVRDVLRPRLVDGSVLVEIETGHERLRYISGVSNAWTREELVATVSLDSIYEAVKAKTGTTPVIAEY